MRHSIYAILLGISLLPIGRFAEAASKHPPIEYCAGGPPCPWNPAPLPPPPINPPELPPRLCPREGVEPPQPWARPELPPTVTVVEYVSDRGSRFYTIDDAEMALLDRGEVGGWQRTGRAFAAWGAPYSGLRPVFRFWIPGTGHVFTLDTARLVDILQSRNAQFEGIAFFVLP
jgi:hypothetical protein